MASRNDVAEAAAELRRRVAWRNEAVGPADHGTVELCYWSVRCMAALMRLDRKRSWHTRTGGPWTWPGPSAARAWTGSRA